MEARLEGHPWQGSPFLPVYTLHIFNPPISLIYSNMSTWKQWPPYHHLLTYLILIYPLHRVTTLLHLHNMATPPLWNTLYLFSWYLTLLHILMYSITLCRPTPFARTSVLCLIITHFVVSFLRHKIFLVVPSGVLCKQSPSSVFKEKGALFFYIAAAGRVNVFVESLQFIRISSRFFFWPLGKNRIQ